ncbi:MAG: ParA family protein [Pseudobdellovibrionaceae bacterium]
MDTTDRFSVSIPDLAALLEIKQESLLKEIQRLSESKGGKKTGRKAVLGPSLVREYLEKKGHRFPKSIISVQMLKGGVAKTTTALNLGLRAHMYGARVLWVDMDQQANLTFALEKDKDEGPVWVDILEKKAKISEAVVSLADGLDLIPSNLNNSVLDRVLLAGHRNLAQAVKGPLSEIRENYDLVIFDTAPNLSAINTAVTLASDMVLLPINPDRFSLLGLNKNIDDLAQIRKEFSVNFEERILFTKFDGRETASHELLTKCIESFADRMMKSYIRTSTDVKNSIRSGKTIFDGKSSAKEDYDLVTREILNFHFN